MPCLFLTCTSQKYIGRCQKICVACLRPLSIRTQFWGESQRRKTINIWQERRHAWNFHSELPFLIKSSYILNCWPCLACSRDRIRWLRFAFLSRPRHIHSYCFAFCGSVVCVSDSSRFVPKRINLIRNTLKMSGFCSQMRSVRDV